MVTAATRFSLGIMTGVCDVHVCVWCVHVCGVMWMCDVDVWCVCGVHA